MKKIIFLCLFFSSYFELLAQTCQNCGVNQATPQSSLHVTGCGSTSGTSAFQVDNSSGNSMFFVGDDQKVGIGTSTPQERLQIANSFLFHDGGHSLLAFKYIPSTATDLDATKYAAEIRFDPVNGNLSLGTSSLITTIPVTHFSINKNGNVGIGTAAPGVLLDVVKTGTNDPIARFGSGGVNDNHSISIANGSGITSLAIVGGTGAFSPGSAVGDGVIRYTSGKKLLFSSGGGRTDMVIDGSGNIGMGTSLPDRRLDVLDGTNPQLRLTNVDGSVYTDFQTNSSGHLSINPSGNRVGIGTANPITTFHIEKTSEWNILSRSANSNSTNRNHILMQRANGASAVTSGFDLGGLTMSGYDGANYGSGWNGGVEITAYATETWTSTARGTALAFLTTANGTAGDIERMRIDNSGNIGVGITAPTSILHTVASGTKQTDYTGNYLSNTATLDPNFIGSKIGLNVQSTGGWTSNSGSAINIGLKVNATGGDINYAAIFQGGGVGIGTTAPNTLLDLEGAISTRPSATVNITADNQVVTVGNRSYLRISSDNATGANRTIVLTGGLQQGQLLTVEFTGTNQGELLDDGALNGGGNQRMSAALTLTQYDAISFIWNGTDWIEKNRSVN